jgi:hypothetical protein
MSDWSSAIDARLIARIEQHTRRSDRLRRNWSVPLRARPPKTHLEPADWGTDFLRADRERDIPMQLTSDLRENMPQALLRDLYRPVYERGWIEREIHEGTADRGGLGAMREAREARQRVPLPRVESGLAVVRAYQTWRRALVAERWLPILDEPPAK